jgi:hypothetical protein
VNYWLIKEAARITATWERGISFRVSAAKGIKKAELTPNGTWRIWHKTRSFNES